MKIQLLSILLVGVHCLFENELWTTGEVDLRNDGDTIFYYLFRPRNKTASKKLVVWLSGGPGCSSTTALFTENGPYMFNKTAKMFYNKYSWNDEYHLMFVDQPVGVGFSRLKDKNHFCKDEVCVATNFHKFITAFYRNHYPEYANAPLYITGESYGGHYVPAIAAYLLRANDTDIPLAGIAVGNGMTDFSVQIRGYADYLLEHKLIGNFGYQVIQLLSSITVIGLEMEIRIFEKICFGVLQFIANYAGIINVYDIRRNDTDDDLDNDIIALLEQPSVQELFGLKEYREFKSVCNITVHDYMLADVAASISSDLVELMESKIKVLIYYGDMDYICNWRSGELLINSLEWKGKSKYMNQTYKDFKLPNGTKVGEFKKADNFTFLVVNNAGHMVPMDQKEAALHMLKTFVDGEFP